MQYNISEKIGPRRGFPAIHKIALLYVQIEVFMLYYFCYPYSCEKRIGKMKKKTGKRILSAIKNLIPHNYSTAAVIVAAGDSTRMGAGKSKQFMTVCGVPVLVRSVAAFQASEDIDYIIVVAKEADIPECRRLMDAYDLTKVTAVTAGGATRRESVLRGVELLDEGTDFVAIHDGARCLVTPEIIKKVLDTAIRTGAASAGAPVKDTIKQVDFFDVVESTPDRSTLWSAGTPQIFKAGLYRAAAYQADRDGVEATDDNFLIERLGGKVTMVDCGHANIKITTPEDIAIAQALLSAGKDD